MGAFEYRQAQEIRDCFARHGIRYLFLGKSGAILFGIASTNRQKDRESLPRLRSFRDYWLQQRKQ